MAENSDSPSKAPRSPYKEVHDIAQKFRIEVSLLFCQQCLKYTCLETDPIALQK